MKTDQLSPRECDVADLLAQGCTNAEIAMELSIAVSTVEKHMEAIFKKLEVGNRTKAALRWSSSGLCHCDCDGCREMCQYG